MKTRFSRLLLATLVCASVLGCSSVLAAFRPSWQPPQVMRPGFLGAFFRPQGEPPFGVFSVHSKQTAPEPYPRETTKLFGSNGYCDAVASNGLSISTGYLVDSKKLSNVVDLGVRWTRMQLPPFFADASHISGPGSYEFGQFDSAQCALVRQKIQPLISLDAGPVQYNANPEAYSPVTVPAYKTAADFGQWCSVVAKHEAHTFVSVKRFSEPGNEVNSNPEMFPGGEARIAAYAQACYHAIKSALPDAVVYGFELNADRKADPAGFVQRLYDLGCKVNTCYDAIAMHISLRYPLAPEATPCYPQWNGDYGLGCIEDVRRATHAAVHIIVGETGYFVPGNVRDEDMKAKAVVDEFRAFATQPYIDGVSYANVDECDLYPSGYFVGGCLVDSLNNRFPAFASLQRLAKAAYN